jgi:anti-sigma B factor antagonist
LLSMITTRVWWGWRDEPIVGQRPQDAGCSIGPGTEERYVEDVFGISEETRDGHSILSVVGELDVATAPELRTHLEETVDRVSAGTVVVDLVKVTFIDSTALGVLISALKRSQSEGGELRLVIAEPRILKIFEITGLTELFSIFPTLAQATGS